MRVTKVAGCIIREATAKDVELVLSFIKRLAQYEKLEDQVTVTLETLYDSLFVKKAAKAIIAELQGMPVGFAVYFHNFSTFLGKPGLYLEDLFVVPEMRGVSARRCCPISRRRLWSRTCPAWSGPA